ncbi:MAG: polysaccharide deacetylase family protein [Candidatus Nanoarchaeia archaeon]|nr:polysaccharide deacetylase family protein [Candidatus Nanoarchaeia archaeon]
MIFKTLLIFLSIFIIGCSTSQPIIVISFDTEYPYGVGFPDNFNQDQITEFTPSEEAWISTLNRINNIGIKHNVKFQFNVVGKTAEDHQDLIKNISENHNISCHSYSHLKQGDLSYKKKESELRLCKSRLEPIIGREIKGNRFPYTNYTDDSFKLLKSLEYEWDSSIWQDKSLLFPSVYKSVREYPLAPITTDWEYFINETKTDSKEFFNLFENDIKTLKNGQIYIIVLHPWIITEEATLDELDNFVARHKSSIKSIDEIYQKAE